MSSMKNGSARGSDGHANGNPATQHAAPSGLPATPSECAFRSLREAADLHDVSHSYLSRRVRNGKAAKGYDLRPYALFKESGSQRPEEKTIFGFAFPPDYKPAHSTVADDQDESSSNRLNGPGTPSLPNSRPESQKTSPAKGSPEDESSGLPTEIGEDVTEMNEDLADLKEAIPEMYQTLRAIGQNVSDEQDRRTQLNETLMKALGELLSWKRSEERRQARLEEAHKELRKTLRQVPRDLREESETLSSQLDHLHNQIDNLREWVDTVVDMTAEDLKRDRAKAFRALSDELSEKIEEPLQELLALHQDNSEENVSATAGGLTAVLLATRLLDKRQIATLIDSAGQVLAENLSSEERDPAALKPGAGTQGGDRASQ